MNVKNNLFMLYQELEYVGIAPFITLPTSGPPLSYRVRSVFIALSFSFLLPMCFLIGVTKFFTCEFKWDPTLSLNNFSISNPRSQIS